MYQNLFIPPIAKHVPSFSNLLNNSEFTFFFFFKYLLISGYFFRFPETD